MKKTHSRNNKQRVRKRDGNYCIGVHTAIGKKENQLEVVKKKTINTAKLTPRTLPWIIVLFDTLSFELEINNKLWKW